MTNVLLITIDSLRFDFLGEDRLRGNLSGIERCTADGVFFEQAFATGPGTNSSFPGILTGTLPLSYDGLGPLSPERPTLARELRDAGLNTAGFHSNPFLSSHFNYSRGFDEFDDYQNPLMGIATKVFPRGIEISNPKLKRMDEALNFTGGLKKVYQFWKGKPRPYVGADVITDDAINWLGNTDEPFFCWTHYMDVHHPCYPPQPYRERFNVGDVVQSEVGQWYSILVSRPRELTETQLDKLVSLYRAAIVYTADQIERLLTELDRTGRYEDTLVILTSDHGELFGDHGKYGKPARMYDELLHVPLIVANGPNQLSEIQSHLVSLLDIPPLIHETLGLRVPKYYSGRRPGVDPERETILAEFETNGKIIIGARSKEWRFEGDEIEGEHRLFHKESDRLRRIPLDKSSEELAVIENVRDRLSALEIEAQALEDDVDRDVRDRLEDLGYM